MVMCGQQTFLKIIYDYASGIPDNMYISPISQVSSFLEGEDHSRKDPFIRAHNLESFYRPSPWCGEEEITLARYRSIHNSAVRGRSP